MLHKILWIFTILLLSTSALFAEEIDIDYDSNIASGTAFQLDLSILEEELEVEYNTNVLFEWDIRGASTKKGSSFERVFQSPGEKEINLTIYRNVGGQKNLIASKNIDLFIYNSSLPFIYDSATNIEQKNSFILKARNSWVYLYDLGTYDKGNINGAKIIEALKQYANIEWKHSDYIWVWWGKEFILNAAGQVNKQAQVWAYGSPINLAIFSSFNKDVLWNFVGNFLSDKSSMNAIIISEEITRLQSIEQPLSIIGLTNHLKENNHDYITVKTQNRVKSLLFISKFVNNLSNAGFQAWSIYLVIIIPILLLGLSTMKHIIGFSPLGIMIPVGLVILYFQAGLVVSLIIIFSMFALNLALAKLISSYTLLYTPKTALLLSINIIFIIALLNLLFQYNLIGSGVESIIFVILFTLIAEKLITVIIGKEFREYKYSLLYTLMFSLVSYVILQFNLTQIFLLAYPEIILLLIPINFWIGRFTWLRITEYFRFREIIHNIDEEE